MDRAPYTPKYQAYLSKRSAQIQESKERITRALESELNPAQTEDMLILARRHGHSSEFVQLVTRYIDKIAPNAKLRNEKSPFMMACELGALEALDLFYSKGVELEEIDEDGKTAIQNIGIYGQAFAWLLERGTNPNSSGAYGWTHLMAAVKAGELAKVLSLLEAGALVDQVDQDGRTALWIGCNRRRAKCVELLLQFGADPNRSDNDGRVPLMLKISKKIATMLIEAGANLNHQDNQGRTVLEVQALRAELCVVILSHRKI